MDSTTQMNVIDTVRNVVKREVEADSSELTFRIHGAISALPGLDATDTRTGLERRWFEYEIEVQSHPSVEHEVAILQSIRPLDIAAAPEVAAVIPFPGGDVIVRRFWACPGERLVPAEPGASVGPVARERFRRDMRALASAGKIHTYARGLAHMFIAERTRTIVLNTWRACTPAEPEDCDRFVASIDRQLERLS